MSSWSVRLENNFYALGLGEFSSVDEAIDEAEAQYASEWIEVYDGNEGVTRKEFKEGS